MGQTFGLFVFIGQVGGLFYGLSVFVGQVGGLFYGLSVFVGQVRDLFYGLSVFVGQVGDLFYLRLRKERPGNFQYSGGMDAILDANWTVAQTMSVFPQTVAGFIALKTDCVGCPLAKFCTLADAADTYDIPLEVFLERLREVVEPSFPKGECL